MEEDTDRMNATSAHRAGPGAGDGERHSAGAAGEILLVYDWECPACDTYCRSVRVPRSIGRLRLVNARETTAAMEEITKAGLDIDQGMVVKTGGQLYYGSDAIHALALSAADQTSSTSSPTTFFGSSDFRTSSIPACEHAGTYF